MRLVFVAGTVFTCLYGAIYAFSKTSDAAKNVLHKFNLWIHGVVHLIFTTETRWKPAKEFDDPAILESEEFKNVTVVKRTLIFYRHGESKWNEVFNQSKSLTRFFKPLFYKHLLMAMFWETVNAVTGDSVFLDSPLSPLGVEQAQDLAKFLEKKEPEENKEVEKFRQILAGNEGESIICSSNLRRALATTTIGLWPRLGNGSDKDHVHVLSYLQESSRNVDTMSLSKPDSVPPLPMTKAALSKENGVFDPAKVYITSENAGNKKICEKGSVRLAQFAEWSS